MLTNFLLSACALFIFIIGITFLSRPRKKTGLKPLGHTALLHAIMLLFFIPVLNHLPLEFKSLSLKIALCFFSLALYPATRFSFHHVVFEAPLLPGMRKIALPLVAILSVLFSLLAFSPSFLISSPLLHGGKTILFGPTGIAFGAFLIASLLIILFQMEQTYRSAQTHQRIRLKFLILGVSFNCLYALILASQILLYHLIRVDYLVAGAVVDVACWAMIAFAVVRHRLLEVDMFISRHVVFTSVAAFGLGLYLLIAGVAGYYIQLLDTRGNLPITIIFVALSLILFAMLLYSPTLQRRTKHFINTHFYRNQYDYRIEWTEFTRKITAARDLPHLLGSVIESVSETLWIQQLSIWLYNEKTGILSFCNSRSLPRKAEYLRKESPLVQYLLHSSSPLSVKSTAGRKIEAAMEDFFKRFHISLVVPLKLGDRLVGMITLGPAMKGTDYIDEDAELLTIIAEQAAGAIISAQLIEEIGQTKEEESFNKISAFLVHDLKNLASSLSLALQNAKRNISNPDFQVDLLSTLVDSIDKMKALIEKLSTLPKELVIRKQPVQFNQLIREALESSKVENIRNVELHTDLNEVPLIQADGEYVKKVLVNLILNAVQALPDGKGRIEISSYDSDGYVRAEVVDDGEGMSDEFITQQLFKPYRSTKRKGLGIGLFQCRTIMEAHGGKIEVNSLPQRGSQFILSFPIE